MILPAIMGATARRFDPDTVLLLPMTGANNSTTFTDIARGGDAPHTVTANGDAKISTAVADPFSVSGGVGTFDGTGDYLTTPDSDDWHFGANDWTIEMWVRFAEKKLTVFIEQGYVTSTTRSFSFYWNTDNTLHLAQSSDGSDNSDISRTFTPDLNRWYHITACRDGAVVRLFADGTQTGADITAVNTYNSTKTLGIMSTSEGQYFFNGQLSDLRISKGVARYTANFTPPARLKT